MKWILDSLLDDAPRGDAEIGNTFGRSWQDAAVEEDEEEELFSERNTVSLECNGDLAELSSVKVKRVRRVAFDAEIIEFVCPRCREPHESVRFR